MAPSNEKLADSLSVLKDLQDKGRVAVRSSDLTRTHRERLLDAGFLREVIRGWLIASNPADHPGDSTSWYSCFWDFCAQYLAERFGEDWFLSPEQSLILHAGNRTIPDQVLVRAAHARNKRTDLVHGTSIFETRAHCAWPFRLCVHPSLSRWQRPNGAFFDEPYDGGSRLSLAGDQGR